MVQACDQEFSVVPTQSTDYCIFIQQLWKYNIATILYSLSYAINIIKGSNPVYYVVGF